jgi:NifU-like protein involved in Fe-S cluster formation
VARTIYSSLVIDHFEHPRAIGTFELGPDVITASAGRAEQGAMIHFAGRVADDRLVALRFRAYGCPHTIAAASWLTEQLTGATLEDLHRWSWREAERVLEVPAEKRGKLLLLEDAVRQLAERWRAHS